MLSFTEGGDDVGKYEGVHKETFGKLEGNARGLGGEDAPDALVDFEVVIGRKKSNGGVESRVMENGIWDLALYESFWSSLL